MKALIAMSGGVDSSVAAYLTKKQGYDCIGGTMRLFSRDDISLPKGETKCSLDDVKDAEAICKSMGIPHYTFDFKVDFKKNVIDRFIRGYEMGLTPNPCVDCNRYLKFQALYEKGLELGCDIVVTGHYAKVEKKENIWLLKKAKDDRKDQSYVLYNLRQEQLKRVRFPLGDLSKNEVRKIALEQGFINADKKESQDICFVPDGDYAEAISRFSGKEYEPGDFVDEQGNIMGRHKGIINYTIGQRKGLGLSLKEPAYVIGKDIENNRIILGKNEDLFSDKVKAQEFNWTCGIKGCEGDRVRARIRYNQKEEPAVISSVYDDKVEICFEKPQRASTPGQSLVIYKDDYVLGGGVIL